MSKWVGNLNNKPEERRSNMKGLHVWQNNHPDSGYSSHPITTPIQMKFYVAYSQALTIGHQNPQVLFPRLFFLHGSLRDPVLVGSLLSLVMPPFFRTRTIKGYKLMLYGTEPALVFGSKEQNVRGVIYVVQSSEDAAKLRLRTKYRVYQYGIQPDDVGLSRPGIPVSKGRPFCGKVTRVRFLSSLNKSSQTKCYTGESKQGLPTCESGKLMLRGSKVEVFGSMGIILTII